MKRLGFCIVVAALLAGCSNNRGITSDDLEAGFRTPPDSVQISTYWYWISGNVTREGVVNDLHAMKRAGINRAFIGNIGHDYVRQGPVKLMSEEWWDITHTALKTATDLGMEIGIFNSPGWSQSGGPWVKPEESMRCLATTMTRVEGPGRTNVKLPAPQGLIQDVKVIAYPEPEDYFNVLKGKELGITSAPYIPGLGDMVDGDRGTRTLLPQGKSEINFRAGEPFTARSVTIYPEHTPIIARAEFFAADTDGNYRSLATFDISRYNDMPAVGFDPYAPITISLPAVTAKAFRLVLENSNPSSGIREIEISAAPRLERYSEKSLAKMHQTPLPYWGDYLWPETAETDDPHTVIPVDAVVDISQYMGPDGTLAWDVPDGKWIILRTGMVSTGVTNAPATPEATGLEIDKMSKEHVRSHFDAFIGKILERIPEADRRAFKVVVQDSYETGGQNFTDDFLEKFKDTYGYDPLPFLPVYSGAVVESVEASDRFLWDVRRLVADAVSYDYVGGMREVAHEHGLRTWLENYGHWGFPGEFLQYGGQSDEVAGEFWSEGSLGDIENRAASSCGHIYGKQKIYAESFTCAGLPYSRYPANMKERCDRFFAEGINSTLLTLFISQIDDGRLPGMNAEYGNEFNRNNVWFGQMDLFVDYLKRCNFMLQQGLNIADVAYFIGEDAPKMTGATDPPLPAGYQFDYINGEVLRDMAFARDGMLTLPHGTQYRLLVLPPLETMRPELLERIAELVKGGCAVLGPKPMRSPSLQGQPAADAKVKVLADELWGEVSADGVREYGKGFVITGMDVGQALEHLECPPDMASDNPDIDYCHRRVGDFDIYFLSNQSRQTVDFTAGFRVGGMQPELWDPVSGAVRDLPKFGQSVRLTQVPLRLEPFESVFVVFRKPAKKGGGTNYPVPETIYNMDRQWTVKFDRQMRGPSAPVKMDVLTDWSASEDESIKFYSGTALYETEFLFGKTDNKATTYLDLGKVAAMARVRLNGKYAGGVWTYPYRVDVTDLLIEGQNKLEVEVVNTWVNRLIGDSRMPEAERPTWMAVNTWKPDSPLQQSGLLGPVTIYSVNYGK